MIESIKGNISFDQAIDWIILYITQIKNQKEQIIKDDYQSEKQFKIVTTMRIDSIESLSKLIRKYLNTINK